MKRFLTLVAVASFALANHAAVAEPAKRTLAEMIAEGNYDKADADITDARFPVKAKRFTTEGAELVGYKLTVTTKAVLADLKRRGLRPATIEELLAYGAEYPNAQKDHDIIALGSSWRNAKQQLLMPGLALDEGRALGLYWGAPGGGWDTGCRFLAFRK